jgi:site-specific recombinase XerD
MTDSLQLTLERYLRLCSQTLRPLSVRVKRLDLQCAVQFLHAYYPKVHTWAKVRRVPHIEEWLNALHASSLKANTRIERIGALRLFFDDMIAWRWPEAPPPGLIYPEDLPLYEHHLPKPLPQEVDAAVQAALVSVHTLTAMGLRLLRLTGMRIGELVDLDVNALDRRDPKNSTLHVPVGKTRKERVIPITPATVDLVRAIQAQRGTRLGSKPMPDAVAKYMMVNPRGQRIGKRTYSRSLKRLTRHIVTTEKIHPHRLRHTFATEMARAGMSVQVLMRILGHENAKMTMQYIDVAAVDLRREYDNALTQLGLLNNLKLPSLTAHGDVLGTLPDILGILITRIESLHRDSADTNVAADLARFVKRLRRTRDDLLVLLQRPE